MRPRHASLAVRGGGHSLAGHSVVNAGSSPAAAFSELVGATRSLVLLRETSLDAATEVRCGCPNYRGGDMSGCARVRALLATCAAGVAFVPTAAALPLPLALLASAALGATLAQVAVRPVSSPTATFGGT